jgi:hypothetical protein
MTCEAKRICYPAELDLCPKDEFALRQRVDLVRSGCGGEWFGSSTVSNALHVSPAEDSRKKSFSTAALRAVGTRQHFKWGQIFRFASTVISNRIMSTTITSGPSLIR